MPVQHIYRLSPSGEGLFYGWFPAMHTRFDIAMSGTMQEQEMIVLTERIRKEVLHLESVGNFFDESSDGGVKMTFDSVISNKFYGLEEQIMGNLGTVEPEKGKYYFEDIAPAPAFLQLINDWENKLFDTLPFAGTSWAPETANENHGEYITGERPKTDGTSLMLDAFVEAVITRKQPLRIAEEGYYASQLCLLGHQAMEEERTLYFPEEYKIDYLNHKSVRQEK